MDCKNSILNYYNRYHGNRLFSMKVINLQNITSFLGFWLIIYLAYMLFYPFTIMTVESMTVINSPVQAWETMIYRVKYCKKVDVPTLVYRTFYWPDGIQMPSPAIMSTTTPWCKDVLVPIQTYNTMKPWFYNVRSNVELRINALRTEYINAETDMFEIITHK